jgi:hypothetical protein
MLKSCFAWFARLYRLTGIVQQVANFAVASCLFAHCDSKAQNLSQFEIIRACESLFLQSG